MSRAYDDDNDSVVMLRDLKKNFVASENKMMSQMQKQQQPDESHSSPKDDTYERLELDPNLTF
jgi:hypothetical protein